jgi:type III pantothenate kinase
MILTLDVGNSQIFGGVFSEDKLLLQFRKTSKGGASSDEMGIFLRSVLRENDVEPKNIKKISVCSVVPDLVHSIKNCCKKYFAINPFMLQSGVKTGLKIKYRNPVEVGADRIANAIGALHLYPGKNLVICDFGTATTYCAVSADKDYFGGLIVPGLRLSMEALEAQTAKLPAVEIVVAKEVVGRSTVESIQAGLFFGNLAMVKEISSRIKKEYFDGKNTIVIGTGGFSRLFEKEKAFDVIVPDLVLTGLKQSLQMNA